MGRIQQLPDEIKAYLDRRLREGATQAAVCEEVSAMLAEIGEPPLSTSTMNRYATRMERMGRRIREAREVADVWTAKFGERPTGDLAQHVIEILRTVAFEAGFQLSDGDDEDAPIDIEAINNLALAVQRLERAAETSAKRERERRQAFAAEAEAEAVRRGMSSDSARDLRRALTTT